MTECSKCNGRGEVAVGYLQRRWPADERMVKCSKCKGEGHD